MQLTVVSEDGNCRWIIWVAFWKRKQHDQDSIVQGITLRVEIFAGFVGSQTSELACLGQITLSARLRNFNFV